MLASRDFDTLISQAQNIDRCTSNMLLRPSRGGCLTKTTNRKRGTRKLSEPRKALAEVEQLVAG
jgi:hypothetical protein